MRGTTPYDRRGMPLALPNGSLDSPSLRFGSARSGLSRTDLGDLAISVKQFLALGISDANLLVRSNTLAPKVTPLSLDRTNATLVDGEETTFDIQETSIPVARLAAYRQSASPNPYRWGWKFYGFNAGLNTIPILQLTGDGSVLVPGSLAVTGITALQGETHIGGTSLEVTAPTTFTGGITVNAPSGLIPPLGVGGPAVPYAAPTPGSLLSLYPTATLFGLRQGASVDHGIDLTNVPPNAPSTAGASIGLSPSGSGHLGGGVANSLSIYTAGAAAGNLILGTNTLPRLTIAVSGAVTIPGAVTIGGSLTLPNGSVTQAALGPLTITEAAPGAGAPGDTAFVGVLLNNLAHQTRGIIGAPGNDWKDAIPVSLTGLQTSITAGLALKVNKAGDLMTGDLTLRRTDGGSPTTGALFFGNAGNYIFWNGSSFVINGAISNPTVVGSIALPSGSVSSDEIDPAVITSISTAQTTATNAATAAAHGHPYTPSTHPTSGDHDARYSAPHGHPYTADSHPLSGDHDARYVNATSDTMSGTLAINGGGTALSVPNGNISVGGAALFGAAITVQSGVSVINGNLSVAGNLIVSGTTQMSAALTLNLPAGSSILVATGVLTTTTAAAGAGGAVPATAAIFGHITVNGTLYRFPLFN